MNYKNLKKCPFQCPFGVLRPLQEQPLHALLLIEYFLIIRLYVIISMFLNFVTSPIFTVCDWHDPDAGFVAEILVD